MDTPSRTTSADVDYRHFYLPVQDSLKRVETLLQNFLTCDSPFISRIAHHGFQLGGKRMRPALLLLFAKMSGEVLPAHEVLAAAIETIHSATLVHDDILDEADTRRHLPTVNAAWNNETSVLLGDFMIARAIRQVIALKNPTFNEEIAQTCCRLCEGEMRQVGFRGDFTLCEAQYLSIIQDKTAALCETACTLGVRASSGATEERSQAAAAFGRNLGMAFQIADDLLDILGEEAQMGKSLGTDLEKQKMTLPTIRLLSTLSPADCEALTHRIRTAPDEALRQEIRAQITKSGVLESVQNTARAYLESALKQLAIFPDGVAKESLENMACYALSRNI